MRRILSVSLPFWATQRLARRLPHPEPAVVVHPKGHRQIVVHAGPEASHVGVHPGMDLAHARALLGIEPCVLPYEPARDAAALEALARWTSRWTPLAAADHPDGLLLDLTGCEHLFGGERRIAAAIMQRLRSWGLSARIGGASTVGAAWGIARFGPHVVTFSGAGGEQQVLGPLPIAALRLGTEAIESLHEVGVRRIEQLVVLPRRMLPARYGDELVRRMDQAFGLVHEAIYGEPEHHPIRVGMELPGGTTQWEAVALAVQRLIGDLATALQQREAGLRRMDATFERLDSATIRMGIQVGRPTQTPTHLWRLFAPRLERLNLGYGITGITLEALGLARLVHRQTMLIDHPTERAADAVGRTIDAISNRLGPDRVRRPVQLPSHRPERAAATASIFDPPPAAIAAPELDRPSVLFDHPEPVRVISLSPDGPVMSITRQGTTQRITASIGPERIGGEWWHAREPGRDYFRLQDEAGRWLWAFREAGAWFIHGEWA